jgi:hypothetical protein
MRLPAIVVLVSLLCFSGTSYGVGFGIKGGLVLADQDFNYENTALKLENERRTGIDVGVFVELFSVPFIGVQIEGHYMQKGTQISSSVIDGSIIEGSQTITQKGTLNYLSIPALAKVSLGLFYIVGGPRADILLSQSSDDDAFKDAYDDLKKVTAGVDIGVGVQLGIIPAVTPLAEIRYSPDLTDAFNDEGLKIRNRSLQLLIGVQF